jgi:hypothetical protein
MLWLGLANEVLSIYSTTKARWIVPIARGLDPDAEAYIAALIAASATVTSTQRRAINDFIEDEKAASRWDLLKRFYLPIWGNADANAVCLKSLTSGTFVGDVTPGDGFVQGDGSTGYFDFGATQNGIGMQIQSGTHFCMMTQADSTGILGRSFIGLIAGANSQLIRQSTPAFIQARWDGSLTGGDSHIGTLVVSARATDTVFRNRRSGAANLLASQAAATNSLITGVNITALARNSSSGASEHTNARMGYYGSGLGMTDAQIDSFTLATLNLWESLTGLTHP